MKLNISKSKLLISFPLPPGVLLSHQRTSPSREWNRKPPHQPHSSVSHSDVQSVGSTPGGRLLLLPFLQPLLACPVACLLVSFASLLASLGSVLRKVVRGILIMSLLCSNPSAHSRYKPGSLWWPVRPYIAWLAVTLASLLLSLLQEHRLLCPEWAHRAVSLRAFALPVPSRWNTFFIPTCLPPFLHAFIQRSPIGEALLSKIIKTPSTTWP